MHVFVAGATGAIGKRLVPQLIARGHDVTATTRRPDQAGQLEALGARPAIVDGLDGAAVGQAVAHAEPDAIIHQMTALSGKPDMRRFDRWFAATNQLRTMGTAHLLTAAQAVGVDRVVTQSYTGWSNDRTGGPIKTENDPLDRHPANAQRETLEAIRYLERAVLNAPLVGMVLRYGNFYGPGASETTIDLIRKRRFPIIGDGAGVWSWIHLDDAAAAAVAAVEGGASGIYNIVDDEPAAVSQWLPYLADVLGAKPPLRIPTWLGRIAAGEVVTQWTTEARGSANDKAKDALDWQPRWRSWRQGFRDGLSDHDQPRGAHELGAGRPVVERRT